MSPARGGARGMAARRQRARGQRRPRQRSRPLSRCSASVGRSATVALKSTFGSVGFSGSGSLLNLLNLLNLLYLSEPTRRPCTPTGHHAIMRPTIGSLSRF
jgi:hypothetical protein